ncbi:hypothetical protein Cal7507_1563 [Calothrix sp. PCC 7507]|nr:hypothetical protein Cal7507_1563 [Calothrix sp. PCC 7507]
MQDAGFKLIDFSQVYFKFKANLNLYLKKLALILVRSQIMKKASDNMTS